MIVPRNSKRDCKLFCKLKHQKLVYSHFQLNSCFYKMCQSISRLDIRLPKVNWGSISSGIWSGNKWSWSVRIRKVSMVSSFINGCWRKTGHDGWRIYNLGVRFSFWVSFRFWVGRNHGDDQKHNSDLSREEQKGELIVTWKSSLWLVLQSWTFLWMD